MRCPMFRSHYAIYDGKNVPVDYTADPADQFNRACQRVSDNAGAASSSRPTDRFTRSRRPARRRSRATGDAAQAIRTTLYAETNPGETDPHTLAPFDHWPTLAELKALADDIDLHPRPGATWTRPRRWPPKYCTAPTTTARPPEACDRADWIAGKDRRDTPYWTQVKQIIRTAEATHAQQQATDHNARVEREHEAVCHPVPPEDGGATTLRHGARRPDRTRGGGGPCASRRCAKSSTAGRRGRDWTTSRPRRPRTDTPDCSARSFWTRCTQRNCRFSTSRTRRRPSRTPTAPRTTPAPPASTPARARPACSNTAPPRRVTMHASRTPRRGIPKRFRGE